MAFIFEIMCSCCLKSNPRNVEGKILKYVPNDRKFVSSPFFINSSSEFHLAHTIFLCPVYGNEPHVVYRIWCPPSGGHERCLAHHDQHGGGGHLLRHVSWSCNQPGAVFRRITPPVSGKGNHPSVRTQWDENSFYSQTYWFVRLDANVSLAVKSNITCISS